MSPADSMSEPADSPSAGALLRAARERRNMTVAALATAIKVAPRKLDALERDRLDELPDLTFARALAQTVCRKLQIDAAPVLALLPAATIAARQLEHVANGLNSPLGGPRRDDGALRWLGRPVFWVAALLLGAAALLLFGRPEWLARWIDAPVRPAAVASAPAAATVVAAPASAADVAPAAVPVAAPTPLPDSAASSAVVVETVHSAPSGAEAAATPGAEPAGALVLRASGESWIEVRDGAGQLLLSRTLLAGEAVGIDGQPPLRATIGNAGAVSVRFRGKVVDVAAAARDNMARLELK